MRRGLVLVLLLAAAADEARAISLGAVAAVTTITVNVLNIKKIVHDARVAAKAAKKGVVVAGKTTGKAVVKAASVVAGK